MTNKKKTPPKKSPKRSYTRKAKPVSVPCRSIAPPSPFICSALKPLESIGSGSGLLYIGDPAYIVSGTTEVPTKLATEKRGITLDSTKQVPNYDLFLEQWNKHEQGSPTKELILPAIAFQESGPGKGMVLPLNASNAILKLRREFDETGKLVRIILDVT